MDNLRAKSRNNMKINFANPSIKLKKYRGDIKNVISKIIDSNSYILGEEVKKFEKNKANEIAIEVLAKYKNIALILIEPNLDESVICATPVTREKNTKGTTINFKDEINIVPKALKISIENTTKL